MQQSKQTKKQQHQHYQSARDTPSAQSASTGQLPSKKNKQKRPSSKQKQFESDNDSSSSNNNMREDEKLKNQQQQYKQDQPIIHSEKNRVKRIIGDEKLQEIEQEALVREQHKSSALNKAENDKQRQNGSESDQDQLNSKNDKNRSQSNKKSESKNNVDANANLDYQHQGAQSYESSEHQTFPSDPEDFIGCFIFANDENAGGSDKQQDQEEETKQKTAGASNGTMNNNNNETKISQQQLKAHRQQLIEASQEDDEGVNSYQSSSEESEDQSMDSFYDNPEENKSDSSSNNQIGGRSNKKINQNYLAPLEFAKSHVAKIEQDMKHVDLMREMEDNYKLIEQETQEYYIEFLSKWKELARKKITQYRKAIETLAAEKEQIVKVKDQSIEALNDRVTQVLKEKEHIVREHYEDMKMRDEEIVRTRIELEEKINIKDKEKHQLLAKIDEKDQAVFKLQSDLKELRQIMEQREEQQEIEFETLQQRLEKQKREFEEQLKGKVEANAGLEADLKKLKSQIDKLQQQNLIQQQQQSQNMSILSNAGGGQQSQNAMTNSGQGVITMQKIKVGSNIEPSSNNSILTKNQINAQSLASGKPNDSSVLKIKNIKLNGIVLQRPGASIQAAQKSKLLAMNQTDDFIQRYDTASLANNSGIIYKEKPLAPQAQTQDNYMTQQQQQQLYEQSQQQSPYQQKQPVQQLLNTQNQKHLILKEIQDKKAQLQIEIKGYQSQKQFYQKIIVAWQSEQKQVNSGAKLEAKKTDPIFKDYSQYQTYIKLIKEKNKLLQDLIEQEQQILTNQNPQVISQLADAKQNSSTSARGSKSLSPRKQISNGQIEKSDFIRVQNEEEKISHSPHRQNSAEKNQSKSIVENLEQQLDILTKERDMLKKSLQSLNDSSQALSDYTQVMNALAQQILIPQKFNLPSSTDESKIEDQYQSILNKVLHENKILRESLKKLEHSLKVMAVIYKNQTTIKQLIFERNAEQNKSQNQITNLDSSEGNKAGQISESIIASLEDKIKKEQHQQLLKLEQEAKKGMEQREEVIKKLQQERNSLRKQVKEGELKVEEHLQESMIAKSQLEKIREESSVGETLLQNQIKEIKSQNVHLWAKFEYETLQRKKLHNILEDMKGKIRVFCRVRPMNNSELQMASPPVITIMDQFTLKIHLRQGKVSYGQNMIGAGYGDQAQAAAYDKEFNFDSCFGPKSSQEQVFEDTKMLIQSAIDGYNVCLFAYGQTGSGKTYTIQGTDESPGIVPRALQELFDIKSRMEHDNHYTITLECYMVELYLDNLHDLLYSTSSIAKGGPLGAFKLKLDIREEPQSGMVYIHNVTRQALYTVEEAQNVYDRGIKSRKVASTNMNEQSSRSHLIYSVVVDTFNNETKQRTRGKLSFVDLAGSERHDKALTNNKERLKEASAINQSLKSLGDVIQNLANGSHRTHIPYRDNKLTHLMKDSLGGNSKTLMFVNISPADYNFSETKMSLYYGERVKQIQNEVSKNVESQELVKLREENEKLKMQLSTVATKSSTIAANKSMTKN